MKRYYKIFILALFFLSPILIWAESNIKPQLLLKSIEKIKPQESHDEIYLLISDLNIKKHGLYTVPGHQNYRTYHKAPPVPPADLIQFRNYWKEKDLTALHNIFLWSRILKNNEKAQITISLMENDLPPWDPDDVLGSVKFLLSNKDHKLQAQLVPCRHAILVRKKALQTGEQFTVHFNSGAAHYVIVFEFVT